MCERANRHKKGKKGKSLSGLGISPSVLGKMTLRGTIKARTFAPETKTHTLGDGFREHQKKYSLIKN